MPYIKLEQRDSLIEGNTFPKTAGELNFLITSFCKIYMEETGDVNYAKLNEIVGVLECCKLEFYRRIVAEYEEDKMEENGDVY